MKNKQLIVLDLIDIELNNHNSLNLRCAAGRRGLSRSIGIPEINRPGLALSGFFEVFAENRIQVFGRGETAFLKKKSTVEYIQNFFSYNIPCCVFGLNLEPPDFFLEEAEKSGCPVLITDLDTTELVIRLLRVLSIIFSPKKSFHGVLLEVYGVGVLLIGESGIGKSEIALELIKSGHRLVADDVVEIYCINGNTLIGKGANKIIGHHMEIRGLGVINITHLFGVGAIREKKRIELAIKLEEWDINKNYTRIGMEENFMKILDVDIPCLDIPVRHGRNISTIIETAAMNERLKNMGYNSAKEFNHNILKWIESETVKSVYFGQSDII
ncbi:MAG: HPr(Ser) kinase/phosphatase [Spirochaetaceae bacterium]|jgi:HPr kinase/phosphorylase|nr:HPr(Ser) kinase/phosphatase [Spirochaetaceae bacterium]